MKRILALLVGVAASAATAGDWPQLRGANHDGRGSGSGVLAEEAIGLSLSWKQPLGSGYSGIAVAEGRAVTLYSDGESDWVVALDPQSGQTVWRQRIDAAYKGHDGSDDGPLSSPAISDGVVYALGPRGQLLALRAKDGSVVWSKTLTRDFGSPEPQYGFATTPLVEGPLLIVQTGASPGKSISGLDKRTGEVRWSLGDERVDYQSPAVLELSGRRQLVVIAGRALRGIDPQSGKALWTHELGENDHVDSGSAGPAGPDRFLLIVSGDVVVFRVEPQAEGYAVRELYRTKELGNTYAVPVYHEGYLYGFRQQFLSCVDAETGQRRWRSRPPGGRGLILVDGQLVVYGAEGHVAVVRATPESYQERATLQALEGSGYTWPAFAGDRIFVRNLRDIAAVSVVRATGARPAVAAAPEAGAFGEFVRQVEAAPDKAPLVERFLASHERSPIVEGRLAHFVYRGDVEDIAIAGTMVPSGLAEPMQRIAGTDLYYRTYELEPGGRWEYEYVLNFGQRVPDPRNPRQAPGRFGQQVLSVVALGEHDEPKFLAAPEPQASRGTLEKVPYKSEILGAERELTVYLPAGYAASQRAYPLLLVHQGQDWLERGLLQNTLDNLIAAGKVAPVVAVFIPPRDEWWLEAGGSETQPYVRMLAEELVPYLEAHYRLVADPRSRAVMGMTQYAAATAYVALKYPRVFGAAALQSAALNLGIEDSLYELIRNGGSSGVRFYHDWNRYEIRNVDQGVDLGRDNRDLHARLEQAGFQVAGGEALDSYGWGGWRSRADRILSTLFPVE